MRVLTASGSARPSPQFDARDHGTFSKASLIGANLRQGSLQGVRPAEVLQRVERTVDNRPVLMARELQEQWLQFWIPKALERLDAGDPLLADQRIDHAIALRLDSADDLSQDRRYGLNQLRPRARVDVRAPLGPARGSPQERAHVKAPTQSSRRRANHPPVAGARDERCVLMGEVY